MGVTVGIDAIRGIVSLAHLSQMDAIASAKEQSCAETVAISGQGTDTLNGGVAGEGGCFGQWDVYVTLSVLASSSGLIVTGALDVVDADGET